MYLLGIIVNAFIVIFIGSMFSDTELPKQNISNIGNIILISIFAVIIITPIICDYIRISKANKKDDEN